MSNIKKELERKGKFVIFLRNAIFLLEDAMNREEEKEIEEYKKHAIAAIDGVIGINSHGELKNADTREEDVKLTELKNSIRKLKEDITEKYEKLPDSLKPKRGWRG